MRLLPETFAVLSPEGYHNAQPVFRGHGGHRPHAARPALSPSQDNSLTSYYSFDPVYILLYSFHSTFHIVQLALDTSEGGKDFLLNGHC
jgi:hypothetical protein